MQINLIWDSSVGNAPNPAAFESAVTYAAQYLDTLISNPITVNIMIGWGEDDNGVYPVTGGVAVGGPLSGINVTYSQLKSDLTTAYAKSGSAVDAEALKNLPTNDPTNGGLFYISSAQEKAWGLIPANSTAIDAAIGFNPAFDFSYDPNNRAMPGKIDAIGVAEHELTHALGRAAYFPPTGFSYAPLDLFRYSASGQIQLVGGQPAYFSIDGGVTGQNYPYDTKSDYADWASTINNDSFGYGNYDQVLGISQTDMNELNVIGFNLSSGSPGGVIASLSLAQQMELIYIGYFNRSADQGGFSFWEGQDAHAQATTATGGFGESAAVALTNIANSFTPQTETQAFYSFLNNPSPNFNDPTVQAGLTTFIQNVYTNLFGHAAESGGLTYWTGQIKSGATGLGAAVLAIANGALGTDETILQNKIAVALDFTNLTTAANLPVNTAFLVEAKAVMANVDGLSLNDASVATAEALIAPWIASQPHAASVGIIGMVPSVDHVG